jgi:hypothetical protein
LDSKPWRASLTLLRLVSVELVIVGRRRPYCGTYIENRKRGNQNILFRRFTGN